MTDVAVVILARDEEENIAQALASVCGWAREVYVVDSGSGDQTVHIASRFSCSVVQHAFEGFPSQRNWSLAELPIRSEWVLFLDADEWLTPELRGEIGRVIADGPAENGFFIRRRLMWMGAWIRRGYYPVWLLRLFRRGKGRCEDRPVNEHILIEGAAGQLEHDFIHEDRKGVAAWIRRHNEYARREAEEMLRTSQVARPRLFGTQFERTRWLRTRVYDRLPLLIRPMMYFLYRYILRGGFLDGRSALLYHFLHALWYPLLIDINCLEILGQRRQDQICAE